MQYDVQPCEEVVFRIGEEELDGGGLEGSPLIRVEQHGAKCLEGRALVFLRSVAGLKCMECQRRRSMVFLACNKCGARDQTRLEVG